eukprot:14752897-Ditylum_brightwellii.AAC.1
MTALSGLPRGRPSWPSGSCAEVASIGRAPTAIGAAAPTVNIERPDLPCLRSSTCTQATWRAPS